MTATEPLRARLNEPVSAAGLAAFRILFGALMVVSVVRFWALGWIEELLLAPSFHFTYLGFAWVKPFSPPLTYALFVVMGLSALALSVGFFTRVAAFVFFVTFTYAELIDKANYLNHYYFVSLVAALLVFLPSHVRGSVDAWRSPARASRSVGRWVYLLLRIQLSLVYFYAGFAKLNADWLLSAEPLRTWLFARGDAPLVGSLLQKEWFAYALSWAGAAFDLTIFGWLWWRPTRRAAYVAAVLFHAAVWALFPIGMFSAIMLVAGTLFFDPAWAERFLPDAPESGDRPRFFTGAASLGKLGLAGAAVFLALQALLPLRFLAYPGDPNWTEEAFRFAWRVMLTEKAGTVEFRVSDGKTTRVVRPRAELSELQYRMMSTQPDMIHEYALHLAGAERPAPGRAVRVYADAWSALNGRPSQRLIDPNVDLAREPRSLLPCNFIVPLGDPQAVLAQSH